MARIIVEHYTHEVSVQSYSSYVLCGFRSLLTTDRPLYRLIDYLLFYVPLKNFSLNGDVTITGEGLQNLDLCSALMAVKQGGIFIAPHLL
jgi:hypothetical protein